MSAAPKTVIELLVATYGEGGGLFVMKGAAGLVVLARFFQRYALIDQIDNIDPVQEVVNKAGGYSADHGVFVVVMLNPVSSQAVA